MKIPPFRVRTLVSISAAFSLLSSGLPVFNATAQSFPDPIPTSDGQIIHTILRSDDPNVFLAKGPEEKARPDARRKENDRKPEPGQNREPHPDAKKAPGKPEAQGECPDCKKPGPPNHPPLAKNHPNPPAPRPGPGGVDHHGRGPSPQMMEEMRKHFEQMRKNHGGPPFARENERVPHEMQPHTHSHEHTHPPVAEGKNEERPEFHEIREKLEHTEKELDRARQSLSMAHKELGDRTLMVKRLEDAIKNYQSQLEHAEASMRKAHEMQRNSQNLAEELEAERRKNAALREDFEVVRNKAQADARKYAEILQDQANKAASDASKRSRQRTEPGNGQERGDSPSRPEVEKKPASRAPQQPEPNKPTSKAPAAAITPIEFGLKQAVNFEERDRVLADAKALLSQSPGAKIKIIGHADDSPYDEVNQDISTNRASFLAAFLRVNGIPSENVTSEGLGNAFPAKDADHNRRVVFEIAR